MSVINTNITSMIGQQNLSKSQSSLQTSMERLSSGLRINSAKDDAAGQAIANRMSAQITGLSTAQRNANDGISVAQTAEGGLNQINDNLQRVRELTVQAQNSTNSSSDLQSIQDEVDQRLAEINRISEETDFNGTRVLSDTAATLNIQVGAQDGQTIEVNLRTIDAASLKLDNFRVADDAQANVDNIERALGEDIATRTFTDSGAANTYVADASGNVTLGSAGGSAVYVDASNNLVTDPGATTVSNAAVTFGDYNNAEITGSATNFVGLGFVDGAGSALSAGASAGNGAYTASIDGQAVTLTFSAGGAFDSGSDSIYNAGAGTATLSNIDTDGLASLGFASADIASAVAGAASADITFTNADGDTFEATFAANGDVAAIQVQGGGTAYVSQGGTLTTDTEEVSAANQAATQAGLEGNEDLSLSSINIASTDYDVDAEGNLATTGGGADQYISEDVDGNTVLVDEGQQRSKTEDPLEQLDNALQDVDNLRSELGAVQNRFESAITNLSTNETNLSAARSRIEDADYAVEVANMTRAQILQQAGTSVLAQANQIPQSVLSLLG